MRRLLALWNDRRGTTAIEYAIIATLISLSLIVGATRVGTNLSNKFYTPVSTNLT